MTTQSVIWSFVLVCVLIALLLIVWYVFKQRKAGAIPVAAAPVPTAVPNLAEDDVTADALPEDGWLALARDLAQRGDLRLAMRALFLATLASLSHRELIRIVKSKSNREYIRELERRGHALAEVPSEFTQSVRSFERVWYGDHVIDGTGLNEFSSRQERIRALAKQQ